MRMAVASTAPLVDALRQYRLLEPAQLQEVPALQERFPEPKGLAGELIRRGWLTPYQANQLLQGKGQELLLGSYVLLERLGEGGMGQVFKARNWKLGRVVALKLIRKERLGNPEAVRRFEREVRAAAALSHPNIVRAWDADQVGGTHFLVMEYLDGATDLARLVKKHGPLPVATACDYIRQAALGLQHALEKGLVHRDVKPSNLLLTRGDVVKVLDLGLARLVPPPDDQQASSSTLVTGQGAVVGTLDFIAPEQILDAHAADIRADLYSLGCTLYFLLTAQVPFPGGTAGGKIGHHLLWDPPAVERLRPDVLPWLAALLRRLMAKDREERFQTPAELVAALAGGAGTGGGLPPTPQGDDTTAAEGGRGAAVGQASDHTLDSGWSDLRQGRAPEATDSPVRRLRRAQERRLHRACLAGGVVVLLGLLVLVFLYFMGPAANKPPEPGTHTPPLAPGQVEEDWLKKVAALPAEKQVQAVAARMKERNRGFDGKVTHQVGGGVVTALGFLTDDVTDISPVRALKGLKSLRCNGSSGGKGKLVDLGPLQGLQLTSLDCHFTKVADLAPLKGMPLTSLHCADTKVADLTPLQGMPLTSLDCGVTKVADLAPLRGMRLSSLSCRSTPVADLAPLKGMPLTGLTCYHTEVADLAPLQGMPLTSLHCTNTKVADLAPLKGMLLTNLHCASTKVADLAPLKGMPLTQLSCHSTPVADLAPLRGLPLTILDCGSTKVADLAPLRGMRLTSLSCHNTPVADLAPLKGMPLGYLACNATKVADLTPLQGMPLTNLSCHSTKVADLAPLRGMSHLTVLNCAQTPVADLAPLKGMKLTALYFHHTKVTDLAVLKGMPLTTLSCHGTPVTDLAPLKGMSLKELSCDFKPQRDAEILRSLPSLEKINEKPAREFWKGVGGKQP
jgi:Leucine-rich repeat (LRR) protein/tRNA A-37 threonylcarbamoyl transferase component Bud32